MTGMKTEIQFIIPRGEPSMKVRVRTACMMSCLRVLTKKDHKLLVTIVNF